MLLRARLLRNPCPCSRSGLLSLGGGGLPRTMGRTMWSYPLGGPHFPLDSASSRGETLVDWAVGLLAISDSWQRFADAPALLRRGEDLRHGPHDGAKQVWSARHGCMP